VKDSENFGDSEWEVQMLASAARIAGAYLNDKSAARTYAVRAAQVNPGADVLRFAYEAAGINYNPVEFENVFAEGAKKDTVKPEITVISPDEPYVTIAPNPANPETTIRFYLTRPGDVNISIYNIAGQKVDTLADGYMSPGTHAVTFDGAGLASGTYFYRFNSKSFSKTGKIMLVK
jgi:hypothetical protein